MISLAVFLIGVIVLSLYLPSMPSTHTPLTPTYSGPSWPVYLFINPSYQCCIALNFAGTGYTDGDFTYANGNYTAQVTSLNAGCPPACATFRNWTSTGGVNILNPLTQSTNITVTGSGNLTLNVDYCCGTEPPFKITFYKNPVNACCTRFIFKYRGYFNDQTGNYTYGNYTAYAQQLGLVCPPNCDFFKNWTSTGGLKALNPNSRITIITVTGPGALTMNLYYNPLNSMTPGTVILSIFASSIAFLTLNRRISLPIKARSQILKVEATTRISGSEVKSANS